MTAMLDAAGDACLTLREAAQLLLDDPLRRGSMLHFGSAGQLVMTGDMHGNLANFDKLEKFCQLERSPARCVILHELIHKELAPGELDLSIDLLVRAAAWKVRFPDNVFMLQSNHELAQLTGQEITKGGRSVLLDFERGVAQRYGPAAEQVLAAVKEYIAALPLAARTASGVFLAHSLPDALSLATFDLNVFERVPTPQDLRPGGAAYALVWGRFQPAEMVDYFARRIGVECFVVGHTPQESGYNRVGRLIIIASDHNHGSFLPIDLSKPPTPELLEAAIRKFVSVDA